MATEAAAIGARSALQEKMQAGPGRVGILIFGVVLVVGLIHYCVRLFETASHKLPAVRASGRGFARGAGIRIRERISRHGQCRGHRDLHSFA